MFWHFWDIIKLSLTPCREEALWFTESEMNQQNKSQETRVVTVHQKKKQQKKNNKKKNGMFGMFLVDLKSWE